MDVGDEVVSRLINECGDLHITIFVDRTTDIDMGRYPFHGYIPLFRVVTIEERRSSKFTVSLCVGALAQHHHHQL